MGATHMVNAEPGPDGNGWWPTVFAVDADWADGRGTSWRAVTNHPTLQARRVDDLLDVRDTDLLDHTYTYDLTPADFTGYIATLRG